jgi:hypothetical protein
VCYRALCHPEAIFANGEHGFVGHWLSLSLLTHFHRVSEEKKLAEQAQQAVALAPIRVVSRRTRTASDAGRFAIIDFASSICCVGISTSRTDRIEMAHI